MHADVLFDVIHQVHIIRLLSFNTIKSGQLIGHEKVKNQHHEERLQGKLISHLDTAEKQLVENHHLNNKYHGIAKIIALLFK